MMVPESGEGFVSAFFLELWRRVGEVAATN